MASKREQERVQLQQNTERLDRWFSLAVRIFVLSIFVVHPLIIMPDTYYSIVDTKRIFYTVMLVAVCFVLVVLAFFSRHLAPGYIQWPGWKGIWNKIRPYEYALLAYWTVMVVSTICSESPYASFIGTHHNNEGLLMQSAYLLTVVIVGRLYKPRESDFMAFCAVATVVSVIGIFQYYGLDFLGLYPEELGLAPVGWQITFISTMSNRNIISTYLCLAFCIAVVLYCQSEKKIRFTYLPMAWIIFYMLILGNTRSGYVGIVVALVVLFPFIARTWKSAARLFLLLGGCSFLMWVVYQTFLKREWIFFFDSFTPSLIPFAVGLLVLAILCYFLPLPRIPQKVYRIGWAVLLLIVIVAGLLLLPVLAEKTENSTFQQAADILDGNIEDNFGSNRIFIWRRALQLVPERPIIGRGPDQFNVQFKLQFQDQAGSTSYDKAHNEYMQFLVDTGILGLLCVLSFYALFFWSMRKKTEHPMVVAGIFAMSGFVVQAFFNFSTPLAHPVVWTLWGILGAMGAENAFDKIEEGKN